MARDGQRQWRLALPWLARAMRAVGADGARVDSMPSADWLASRGQLHGRTHPDWRRWLLDLTPGGADLLRRHAAGPCVRALDTGSVVQGTWACASPVHLVAALDHLLLSTEPMELDADESAVLCRSINEHLADSGFRIHPRKTSPWLLECPGDIDCLAVEPAEAAGCNLRDRMPGGPDGRKVRSLTNEIQMLLHEHPINVSRARRGVTAVNSLWFWGFGRGTPPQPMAHVEGAPLPALVTDDAWLAGLWRLNGGAAAGLGDFPHDPLDEQGSLLVGWATAPAADGAGALEEAERQAFAPALAALRANVLDEVACLVGDRAFAADRRARWRCWRAGKHLAEVLA